MVRGLVIQKIGRSTRVPHVQFFDLRNEESEATRLVPSIGWAGRDSGQSRFNCMPRTSRKEEKKVEVDVDNESD